MTAILGDGPRALRQAHRRGDANARAEARVARATMPSAGDSSSKLEVPLAAPGMTNAAT